jgi:hypothetical protein
MPAAAYVFRLGAEGARVGLFCIPGLMKDRIRHPNDGL